MVEGGGEFGYDDPDLEIGLNNDDEQEGETTGPFNT